MMSFMASALADVGPDELLDSLFAEPGQVGFAAAPAEVVDDDDVGPGPVEPRRGVTSDEPGPARDDELLHLGSHSPRPLAV